MHPMRLFFFGSPMAGDQEDLGGWRRDRRDGHRGAELSGEGTDTLRFRLRRRSPAVSGVQVHWGRETVETLRDTRRAVSRK